MEDIRIMRKTTSKTYKFTTSGVAEQIITYSKRRISLIVAAKSGGAAATITLDNNPAALEGIPINPAFGPLMLNINDHGSMVFGPWYINRVAGLDIFVTETFLEAD